MYACGQNSTETREFVIPVSLNRVTLPNLLYSKYKTAPKFWLQIYKHMKII